MATSCHTWASSSHIRHPWFDTVIMKRKHREIVSPEDEPSISSFVSPSHSRAAAAAAPPPKRRRRFSELEKGFAHMSLSSSSSTIPRSSAPAPTQQSPIASPSRSSNFYATSPSPSALSDLSPCIQDITPVSMDTEPLYLAPSFPSSKPQPAYIVEEPRVPEVKMKASSWYEPEPDRIIITDMDSFTQSDDEVEVVGNSNPTINGVLLDRIRASSAPHPSGIMPSRVSLAPTSSSNSSSNSTQALVLFKPLPLGISELERMNEAREKQRQAALAKSKPAVPKVRYNEDDDAMDVEP